MHLQEFSKGKSLIHSLDPRIKLVVFMLFIVTVAVKQGIFIPAVACIVGIVLVLLAKLRLKPVLIRALPVNLFIVFLWIFLPFSVEGRSIFVLGPFAMTMEGVIYAFSITLKANAIILSTIAVITTIPVFQLVHAMIHLKISQKLVTLFFFCYRYIGVIHDEYNLLKNAVKVRGFVPVTNMHTYKSYAYLIGALIIKSYDHALQVYNAMLCRGFSGYIPSFYHFSGVKMKDYVFALFMLIITGGMILI